MNLNTSEWKEFFVGNLFDEMYKGKAYTDEDIEGIVSEMTVPYVTRTDMDNGCKYMANITDDFSIEEGNAITIGDTTATCFYQKDNFITGDHMVVLRAEWLNQLRGLFMVSLFGLEKLKYSYGRAYKMDNIKKTIIKLPIQHNSDGSPLLDNTYKYSEQGYVPDWQFMEDYIKSLHYKPLTTKRVNEKKMELNVSQWEDFVFDDIFKIIHGTRLTKEDMEDGNTPFIGAIDSNNGVREYIGQAPLCNKNCVTVNYNGSVGEAFYQNRDFWASDDVNSLYAKGWQMNPQIGLFLATVIKADKYRYTYGRKWNAEKMRISVIKLPIQRNDDGIPVTDEEKKYHSKGYIPDWQFMEDYINSLPYSDRIV